MQCAEPAAQAEEGEHSAEGMDASLVQAVPVVSEPAETQEEAAMELGDAEVEKESAEDVSAFDPITWHHMHYSCVQSTATHHEAAPMVIVAGAEQGSAKDICPPATVFGHPARGYWITSLCCCLLLVTTGNSGRRSLCRCCVLGMLVFDW